MMRLLAANFHAAIASPASVTSPFPDESGPQGLTRFDAAYLEALYSLPPNAPALRMAGAVARIYESDE